MNDWFADLRRWLMIWLFLFLSLCVVSVILYWEPFWAALSVSIAASFSSLLTLIIGCIGLFILIFAVTRRR